MGSSDSRQIAQSRMETNMDAPGKESPLGAPPSKRSLTPLGKRLSHTRPTMPAADHCKRPGVRAAAGHGALLRLLAALALCSAAHASDPSGGISEKPFSARPEPRGKTLFTLLPPEATGVKAENHYDDPRMWADLYHEFEDGSIGTGVAIGDYDGDGRPDIFVVTKTGGCRLYRNLGGYRFEDVTEKAGVGAEKGVWNVGATFVDVNNDGLLDIYVCRFNAPNLLYVNQGDGTFKEMAHAYGLDIRDASVMASFCDYDRDGWLDVYIAVNLLDSAKHPDGQRGYLLHNNRNNTFTDVTEKAGISGESQSHSATWWDYDNDGWPDLYVANDYAIPDKLYHNNRDGTFTNVIDQVLPHTSSSSMGSDLGDVRNDGRIDLLVADMAATNHQKDQRSMATEREGNRETSSPTPKDHRSALHLNTGTGRCEEAAILAGISATDWTWSVRLEDLDNDGRLDLFVTNGFNRNPDSDVIERASLAGSPAERIRVLYESPVRTESHIAFRNVGDLDFENVSSDWGMDQRGVSFGAAFGDLNGDGNLDGVYANLEGPVTILRNDCDTGHRINVDLRGTTSNRFGVGATVRVESALGVQVRQLVLARGYLSSSEPMLHFGLGGDTVVRRMVVTWPNGRAQSFENLAVDRRYTVTEPPGPFTPPPDPPPPPTLFREVGEQSGLSAKAREEELDETYLQRLIPVRMNRRGPALAVGDVLGNGRDDVIIGGTTLDPLRVLGASEPGSYRTAEAPPAPDKAAADDGPVLLLDAAGLGRADLLVTKGGNALPAGAQEYQPKLYLNDGKGGYREAPEGTLPALPINAGAVAAADFDHSGRLGLFIGGRLLPGSYPAAPRSALLANRGGTFEDVTDTLAPGLREVGMVTGALWSDVDGDGWPDLLVTLEWGSVRYFHNNKGQGFEDWTEKAGFAAAGTGWWTSIASADFNGDGRPDFVVGNVGLNTQYHADRTHPALLFSGDFRGDHGSELVEAYYEGDTLYPWRSRKILGASIPSILKRFTRTEPYARATLGEILGEDRLARAKRYAATELRSGVFLSQPDGTYRFEPLPRIAQISPLQGLAAGYFGGDGHADIYAVQNSFAPIPSVGRFDGGLGQLLRGDGRGNFAAVPPAESGLVVPGDAKAMAVIDLGGDGWPGFLVTRNNSSALAFRHTGSAGHRPLRVVLRGAPGNPTAVGARVSVELSDGSIETEEVAAGSGYYSQSTAACFFGYAEGTPPRRILVRWPSGATTEHAFPAGTVTLTLTGPSR